MPLEPPRPQPVPERIMIPRPGPALHTTNPSPIRERLLESVGILRGDGRSGGIIAVVVPTTRTLRSTFEVVGILAGGLGMDGVVVTAERPASFVIRLLEGIGTALPHLRFLDIASAMISGPRLIESPHAAQITILDSFDLPAIESSTADALQAAAEASGGEQHFVVFDNLAALLPYHPEEDLAAFVKGFFGILRESHVLGVILLPSDAGRRLVSRILGLADRRIEVD